MFSVGHDLLDSLCHMPQRSLLQLPKVTVSCRLGTSAFATILFVPLILLPQQNVVSPRAGGEACYRLKKPRLSYSQQLLPQVDPFSMSFRTFVGPYTLYSTSSLCQLYMC